MKSIINKLFATVAAAAFCAACTPVAVDIFPTGPVAPVMDSHNDILVTPSTEGESVSFTWTKARNFEVGSYELYVKYSDTTACLAKGIKTLMYTTTKKGFNDFLKTTFKVEESVTVTITMYASAVGTDGKKYDGSTISLGVYSCGDLVPGEITSLQENIVLDINKPTENITVCKWSEARLGYNVTPKYDVMLQVGEGTPYTLSSGLSDLSCTVTVDALNDAVVTAGGKENEATIVTFYVLSKADGVTPESGLPSAKKTTSVTTYSATFPEKVYLPGNHQGWKPETAPTINVSTVVKGQYEGFVDLQVAGGGNCEFKFCVKPSWGDDFAIDNISVTTETGDYVSVSGSGITGDNIVVPSGVYWIQMSKKFKTLQMVQIKELNLIGDFCGWQDTKEITLSMDPDSHSFISDNPFILAEDQSGTGYKVRFNKQWKWSLGICKSSTGVEYFGLGGDNASMTLKAGKYNFKLDCDSNPVVPKFISLDMPETLVLAGDYSGHSWSGTDDVKIYLKDADKGIYKGYVTMMFTETPQTWGFKVVKNGKTWIGTSSATSGLQHNIVEGGGENMKPANGHYYVLTDMINMTLTLTPLTSVGIIGDFAGSGWSTDIAMAYDSASMTWSCDQTFAAGNQFKFRFNGTWDYNLGTGEGGTDSLIHEGGNITVAEAGTYHIVLDMHNTPSFTMTK